MKNMWFAEVQVRLWLLPYFRARPHPVHREGFILVCVTCILQNDMLFCSMHTRNCCCCCECAALVAHHSPQWCVCVYMVLVVHCDGGFTNTWWISSDWNTACIKFCGGFNCSMQIFGLMFSSLVWRSFVCMCVNHTPFHIHKWCIFFKSLDICETLEAFNIMDCRCQNSHSPWTKFSSLINVCMCLLDLCFCVMYHLFPESVTVTCLKLQLAGEWIPGFIRHLQWSACFQCLSV